MNVYSVQIERKGMAAVRNSQMNDSALAPADSCVMHAGRVPFANTHRATLESRQGKGAQSGIRDLIQDRDFGFSGTQLPYTRPCSLRRNILELLNVLHVYAKSSALKRNYLEVRSVPKYEGRKRCACQRQSM